MNQSVQPEPPSPAARDRRDDYAPTLRRALLAPRYWGTWAGLGVMRALHWLPRPLTAALTALAGELNLLLGPKRRRIARANLRLCFPEWSARDRGRCLHRHFRAAAQCMFDYGLLWWAPPGRLARHVRLVGVENFTPYQQQGRQIIFLTAHFIALEIGAAALQQRIRGFGLIKPARNPVIDWHMTRGRKRFGEAQLFLRDAGLRSVVRAIRDGWAFYYLPDEDFGPEQSVFVPFLGTVAATLTTLGRLARLTGAVVIPCSTRVLPHGRGYEVRVEPALADFPSGDERADAARMREVIGAAVRAAPEQYMWTFKLFKTRPNGAPSPYGRR